MSLASAEEAQQKIDALQKELHAAVAASDFSFAEKRAAVLSERDAAVADMIASKQLPEDFWATAIVSFLTLRRKEDESMTEFLGPYDAALLKAYLQDVSVVFKPRGLRLTMRFRENPFFEETELFAEMGKVTVTEKAEDANGDHDEESEDGIEDETFEFSGITWKPGHGPFDPDDDEDDEEDAGEGGKSGHKRPREERGKSATQGPTMLEVFSVLAPHPEDDSELDEDIDDDEMADMVEEWRSEVDDRKELLSLLAEEMLTAPHLAIKGLAEVESVVDELAKKAPKLE